MKKRLWKRIGWILTGVTVLLAVCFFVYVSDYYHADEAVTQQMQEMNNLKEGGNYLSLQTQGETGLIFYPGAKVEKEAYLPLLEKLEEKGISCYLVEMPFHLAFFGSNRADQVMEAHPEITHWYLAGHSLGGAFASAYSAKHSEEVEGVVLLGAYLYGDYPVEQSLTIYGSEDQVLNREKITYEENVKVIEGGNHAQFGNYGEQKGDGDSTITAEEQQDITVELIEKFISEKQKR